MKIQLKRFEPIRVLWVDSVHESGWKREKEYIEDGEIDYETIGLYGGESKRTLKIFQSRCLGTAEADNFLVDGFMQIPKVAITKIIKLK